MSKHIIELNEDCKIVQQICVTEHGNAYTDGCYSCDLEALNSDYINEHFGELQDEAYQAGLNDAWEAAKKLYLNGACKDLFGEYFNTFIKNHTAQESIAKLKAYENKHTDRIEVGDIVDVYGNLGVVTYMYELEACVMMVEDGSSGNWNLNELTKTGKHYDIASILEAMRNE